MSSYPKAAPMRLAQLAVEMRGWDYDDIRGALIACSEAGWPVLRVYTETFRLLLRDDATPGDLREAAKDPAKATRSLSVVADPDEVARAAAYSKRKTDELRAQLPVPAPTPPGGAA